MTVGDVTLADATLGNGADSPRVSTRVRARIAITDGDGKLSVLGRVVAVVRTDLRRWWLIAARPVSLRAWLRTQRPPAHRVPDDNPLLRAGWTADNWSTGLVLRAVSVALYLAAGAAAWLAGHPARRWVFFVLTGAGVALVAVTIHRT